MLNQNSENTAKTTNPDKDLVQQRAFMSDNGSNYVGSQQRARVGNTEHTGQFGNKESTRNDL